MNELLLFQKALNLGDNWQVIKTDFKQENQELHIYLDFEPGVSFACPKCQTLCKVHDTKNRTWQHLDFFEYHTFLHARVPRIDCDVHGVKQVDLPWARPNSGFTFLMETNILLLAANMPVLAVARYLKVTDKRIWRVIKHYVNEKIKYLDLSQVKRVGVDETASKRGHSYVTSFVDMDKGTVIFVTEGKDMLTVKRFVDFLQEKGGSIENITEFSSDLSSAFISGVEKYFPKATITFDRFHVMKLLNIAVDETRRMEQKKDGRLKKTRYLWLKNQDNLSDIQAKRLEDLMESSSKITRAYRIKMLFQDAFRNNEEEGIRILESCYSWAIRSRIEPIKKFARTLKKHWDGIVNWFKTHLTNGLLEGINSLVQAARYKAKGYRPTENFKLMIYFIAGGMKPLAI